MIDNSYTLNTTTSSSTTTTQVGHRDSFSLSPLSQLISLLTTGSLQGSAHSADPLMSPRRGGVDAETRMDMSPLVTTEKVTERDSERGSSSSDGGSTPFN